VNRDSKGSSPMTDRPEKIKFHYIKGHQFRVVHVDGAVASISPTGDIVASLFSQRPPIPQLTVQTILENGQLGDEIVAERIIKDGLVREVEVTVTARPEIVAVLIKLLQEKLDEYNRVIEEQQQRQAK
jgi:hypothetical protein